MYRAASFGPKAHRIRTAVPKDSTIYEALPLFHDKCSGKRQMATGTSCAVPHLTANDLSYARQTNHVRKVFENLQLAGILKVSLGFEDNKSQYLEHLIMSLHEQKGHQLPISHSASRGWFWDVRPNDVTFQSANCQARSETMEEFPWHTDCSYENPSPRYFALQVLQPDRYGGGTLSVMNVKRLSELLSPVTRASLMRPEYRISVPPEFVKSPTERHIIGSVLGIDESGQSTVMRFRGDILTPLSARASMALEELKWTLQHIKSQPQSIMHLGPKDLPGRSIILVNNRRWLHARNSVKDSERHLRRVRWDPAQFPSTSHG